ncbi:hypothetical protein PHET_06326 [Paragonimus heterotremus]|uniref:Uncharacterized protein n=1 Tax=Paragonimus heterotremus TaxID=100268 RepID=A0A8J4SWC4_9TREM|nr:hypothetical protein PHET_06326 [Paragonimus heterotremus]
MEFFNHTFEKCTPTSASCGKQISDYLLPFSCNRELDEFRTELMSVLKTEFSLLRDEIISHICNKIKVS